tara:strand:+ start:2514 stop:2825 length:312 start_codon:yes stop_codon:yes gene_type:complete
MAIKTIIIDSGDWDEDEEEKLDLVSYCCDAEPLNWDGKTWAHADQYQCSSCGELASFGERYDGFNSWEEWEEYENESLWLAEAWRERLQQEYIKKIRQEKKGD